MNQAKKLPDLKTSSAGADGITNTLVGGRDIGQAAGRRARTGAVQLRARICGSARKASPSIGYTGSDIE